MTLVRVCARALHTFSCVVLGTKEEWTSLVHQQPLRAARVRSLQLVHSFLEPIEQLVLPAALASLDVGDSFSHPTERLSLACLRAGGVHHLLSPPAAL